MMEDNQSNNQPTVSDRRQNATGSEDQECNIWETQTKCGLILLVGGGYYGVIILAIYVCLRRGNLILSFVVFLFVLFPLGLKVGWVKFSKWQAKKDALRRNAEQFNRLSMRGTEQQAAGRRNGDLGSNQLSAADISHVFPEANSVPPSSISQISSWNDNEVLSSAENRTPFPPGYTHACPSDLPPSYDEVIKLYGQPKDIVYTVNDMQPQQQQQQQGVQQQQHQQGDPPQQEQPPE